MTMTIDELLAEASRYAKLSTQGSGSDPVRNTYAQISQACAETVLATIAAQLARTAGLDTAIRVFE